MSAEAIVAMVSIGVALLLGVLGFMWRNLVHQIAAVRSDLTQAIGDVRSDLRREAAEAHGRIESSIARVESNVARVESNVKAAEDRLTAEMETVKSELTAAIDKQTDRIVELHRDLRGLGERVARVEARG